MTPIGPLHRGPGEINYPIACGGIVVNPGDMIVGDLNGVVVVPREIADELAAAVAAITEICGSRASQVTERTVSRSARARTS